MYAMPCHRVEGVIKAKLRGIFQLMNQLIVVVLVLIVCNGLSEKVAAAAADLKWSTIA